MLHATIRVDESGDEPIALETVWNRLRALLQSEAQLRELKAAFGERALRRLQGVCTGLDEAGYSDAIHVFVGRKLVFHDPAGNTDDLGQALAQTIASGRLSEDFDSLRLVVSHVDEDLHMLVDTELAGRIRRDRPEVSIRLAGRDRRLMIHRGEEAQDYGQRVLTIARNAAEPGAMLACFEEHARAIATALGPRIPGSRIQVSEPRIRLIRTGTRQVGRFRNLGFGRSVRAPTYRSTPTHKRGGAYDSPFYYYYFDPYQDLLHWLIVEDMLEAGTWNDPRVEVVARTGELLFEGPQARAHAQDRFEVPRDAVRLSRAGLVVSEDVPHVSSMDPVEIGSPHGPGYGGEGGG